MAPSIFRKVQTLESVLGACCNATAKTGLGDCHMPLDEEAARSRSLKQVLFCCCCCTTVSAVYAMLQDDTERAAGQPATTCCSVACQLKTTDYISRRVRCSVVQQHAPVSSCSAGAAPQCQLQHQAIMFVIAEVHMGSNTAHC
jgi:hypothetical protein